MPVAGVWGFSFRFLGLFLEFCHWSWPMIPWVCPDNKTHHCLDSPLLYSIPHHWFSRRVLIIRPGAPLVGPGRLFHDSFYNSSVVRATSRNIRAFPASPETGKTFPERGSTFPKTEKKFPVALSSLHTLTSNLLVWIFICSLCVLGGSLDLIGYFDIMLVVYEYWGRVNVTISGHVNLKTVRYLICGAVLSYYRFCSNKTQQITSSFE